MFISLVMATVGRCAEVETFMNQLAIQTYRSFELILVDQNEDDRLVPLVRSFEDRYPIVHLRCEKGLSRARNVGIQVIQGELVSFPDDDCWYDPDVLERAVGAFTSNPRLDVLTGKSIDVHGHDSNFKFDDTEGYVDKENVWRRAISFTIFLRKRVIDDIGGFDEGMGVGASTIYLSGEETDYVLRALDRYTVYYDPAFRIRHPDPLLHYTPLMIQRAYKYGCGYGKVIAKHHYPFHFKMKALIRPLLGSVLFGSALQFPKSHYYWNSFRGRLRGML